MNYSEDYISNFGKQTGFINSNIEKVIRLLDILAFIDSNLDPYLLFEPNDAERAAKHPMAKWRAANLKK